jgi:AcrR family transcriptional regulator
MAGRTAVQRKADEDPRLKVRAPAQTRARETLERIIAAAQRLLRKQRFEDITIAEIVAEADTSTGSFYARFGSKEALLPYLYDAYNADTAAATADVDKRGDLQARTLRGAVAALIGVLHDGPVRMDGLVRTMVLYARSHPERLPESAFKRTNVFYDMVVALFNPHMKARDRDRRARMAAYAIATLLRERRFFPDAPLSKTLGMEHEDFTVEVERMAAAYLEAAP